jgi:HAE1 family hydrophobic/amphiphilic exporter-1
LNLPLLSVRRPVATITILLIILVIGAVSLFQTPLDLLPEIKPPYLAVITIFPGTSPQENLTLVTEPIEDAISPINGVKNVLSLSQEHVSMVALEFNWGADLRQKREEIGTRLDLATLPEEVQRPVILEFDPTLLPVMQVDVSSSLDAVELTDWLESTAKPRLETIPGVASLKIEGGARRDLFIRLFPDLVEKKKISFEQAANILRATQLNFPGGNIEVDQLQRRIRLVGRSPGPEELKNLIVGFQLDEAELKKLIGRSVDLDLNRMLSEAAPSADSLKIPLRQINLGDLIPGADMFDFDEKKGLLTIIPDRELLDRYGIDLEQIGVLLPEEWAVQIDGKRIVIALPPDESWDSDLLKNAHLITVPDFEAWKEQLQGLESEIRGELDRASQQLEKMIVDMATAMILSSAGGGAGAIPIPEDEFPLIPIRLGEIAEVKIDRHDVSSISRFNRQPSIGFHLQKEGEANTVIVSRQVRRVLNELAEEFNKGGYDISFNYTFDQAKEIENALMDLGRSLLLGSLLAVAVLLIFLRNWRTILVIGLTIPIAIIAAFALLYFAGLSVNLMTLGALALAAGMLVDNAIVVSENIYRHLQLGSDSFKASVEGSNEVSGAIFASTLTTISVFFPVVFLSGLAGELFKDFSLTVTCALLASLLAALTLIPMLASRFLRRGAAERETPGGPSHYRRLLESVLNYPWAAIAVGAVAIAVGAILIPFMGSDLFPTPEESAFSVELFLPQGTPLERTDASTRKLEGIIEKLDNVDSFTTQIGEQELFGIAFESGSTNRARIRVAVPPEKAEAIDGMIKQVEKEAVPLLPEEAELGFKKESLMDATGLSMGLEIMIQGPEQDRVIELSRQIAEKIEELPGLADVRSASEEAIPEVHIRVDQEKALRQGLTAFQVGMMLYEALDGVSVARLETDEGIFDLILSYRKSDLQTIGDLENLGFYSAMGGSYLRLGDIATIEQSLGPLSITRENKQTLGRIQAQLHGVSLSEANRAVKEAIDAMELPPGYSVSEATAKQMSEVFDDLYLVLVVAIFLVYLVMAAQFESFLHPFIIISSLPLALSGAVIGLIIAGHGLSIPAMIGGVVLVGILVNSGIIMVDFINQLRRIHGLSLEEAIISGASARLRPILMTTLTTILGLIPLSLGLGQGSQLQAPMAVAVIGGMTSGTILLLGFIPALYYLINRRTA